MCTFGVGKMAIITKRKEHQKMCELGDGTVTRYYEDGQEDAELDMECSTLAVAGNGSHQRKGRDEHT